MTKTPRICLFDIETAPSLGYFWGKLYETDIIKVDEAWYMLCFTYKWLGEKKLYTKALCDYPLYAENLNNDFFLVKDLHKVFDEADILIAHNGDRFDIRKAQARMIKYGMKPPSPYKTIDTLKAARKHFQFESNRLNDLGQYLGFGKKLVTTGFDLWERVMKGDLKAWHLMKRYNQRDVVLLEKVYNEFRPWMTTHPNLQLYKAPVSSNNPPCPNCLSPNTAKKGSWLAAGRRYRQHLCRDCGKYFKGAFICSTLSPEGEIRLATRTAIRNIPGLPCPNCGSTHTGTNGFSRRKGGKKQNNFCFGCNARFVSGELIKS